MTKSDFIHILTEEYQIATFLYNNKKCGIEPETHNSVTTYCMWYGNSWKDYGDINQLMSDGFFDGKSLNDIFSSLNIVFA